MVLDEIGAWLESHGAGTLAADLFMGQMPDTPDTAIAIFEYGGMEPEGVHNSLPATRELPRLQIMSRSPSYGTAREAADTAWRALDFAGEILEGTYYLRCRPLQSPFSLGRDANDRWRIVFNVQIEKALS